MLSRTLSTRQWRLAHRLLYALNAQRALHTSTPRAKWLSAEEAKWVPNVPVGNDYGHPEDPERNTFDGSYHGSPEKGDKLIKDFYYREPREHDTYLGRKISLILTGFFWYWVFYHLYHDYTIFTGHFYMPYMEEFTDEELGIPPDDAPDPLYWGNHEKLPGTYR